ncbi:c-type cytochrome [Bythopirellula polymerisocia]|uniref:Cytochrome c n=1 Tax=Bythopirellula polymerisocia TaxID=2528003 RepID=A0A5C6D1T1_9BACT|nr:c-type cytochrome [Bythopirellula polymerisocia]TWU29794.1 Cytochrome c [Bythopirellula polymerisocia]
MRSLRVWSNLLAILALLVGGVGCRREAPPSFSPGAEVQELTAGLEDAEEIEIYEGLQSQIAEVLRKKSGTPDKPIALGDEETSDQLKLGYAVYTHYCTQCHGVNGDGNGPAATYLNPKPRNYTHGVFKFTSTPYGKKPRRADLIRTVRRGVTGTSMPSFDRLSDQEVDAVVDYVLALTQRGELERELAMIAYEDEELPNEEGIEEIVSELLVPWQDSSDQIVMPITPMPPMTDESVLAGHKLFLDNACNKCHGKFGRGGSMEKVEVGTDTWGNKAAAADLSSGMFRGGDRPIDIYRRIYSGINGTPMPAFEKLFQDNPDAIWQLVHFIKSTGDRRRQGKPPLSEADMPTEEPATEQPAEPTKETEPTAKAA